jgi:hypothetical protein
MTLPSAAALAHGLKGSHFPASKKQLVEIARNNKAPQEVIDSIEQLPDQEFASITAVEHAFSKSHHLKAAEHLEQAAKLHKEAAQHNTSGNREKAAYHAHGAHAHVLQAVHHANEAAKAHLKS